MKRSIFFLSTLTVFFLMLTSGIPYAGNKDVVAKVGSREITNAELNYYLKTVPKNDKIDTSQIEVKKDLLKAIVNRLVLANKAREKGLDKNEETQRAVELAVNTALTTALIENEISKKIEITDDDIKLYYSTKKDEFKLPETVRARHILIRVNNSDTGEDRKRLKAKAEDILKRARAGEDFAELAKELSDDASKGKGGDLGYFPRGKAAKQVEDAAFAMKPGDISDVVESKFGYHIIKIEDRKAADIQPLDEVRMKIKQNIFESRQRAHIKEYLDQAVKDEKAELFLDKIDAGR